MSNSSRYLRGSSLIEVLLYVALLSLVGGALFQVVSILSEAELTMDRLRSVRADVAFAMEKITADGERAEDVLLPAAGQSGSVLALRVGGADIAYSCVGQVLTRSVGGGAGIPLHDGSTACTSLSVDRVDIPGGPDMVRWNLTMTAIPPLELPGGIATETRSGSVQLR